MSSNTAAAFSPISSGGPNRWVSCCRPFPATPIRLYLCWSSDMRFRFIEDRRADYPVTILCDVLGVSPAGYYAWRARPESRRAAADRELVEDIRRVHRDTRGRYGSPRIHVELKAQGRGVSRGR